ncbi:MAG: carboxypeptidase-like regulatory domain-containing protein [Gemmatimonadota bacterium]|nr:carboxypeptidase-like regulatory domain-containing protein [Gemmatimonadota bacterium]
MLYPNGRVRRGLMNCAIGLIVVTSGDLAAQTPECPGYDPADGIIWGVVRATEGAVPVPGANVVVRWSGGETRAQSLRNGIYIVCGVRTNIPILVQASLEQFDGQSVAAELSEGEVLEVPLGVAFGGTEAAAVTGRVVGTVVDRSTMRAVPNALVGAGDRGFTSVSDGAGRFQLDDVDEGLQTITVRHLAYGEIESAFQMPRDGTLEVQVLLDPAVLPVAPIEVEIVGVRSHKLEMSGFYERRDFNERLGLGHYVTRLDIEERGAGQVSHILSDIPRVQMMHGRCFTSRCDFPVIVGSNPACRKPRQSGVEIFLGPSLYLNGRRVRQVAGQGINDFAKPGDIAGIEVYTGSGDLPGEFADFQAQSCGAIVLWTGR